MDKENNKIKFKGTVYYYKQRDKKILDILKDHRLTANDKVLEVYNMIEGFN